MKALADFKFLFRVFLVLAVVPVASAQILDSSAGIGAGFPKLFNNVSAFSAATDVRSLNTNRQETVRMPMNLALLDGKVRMEVDMTQMRGSLIQPALVNEMKRLSLERVISVIRVDKRMNYVIFPGVKSYVPMDMTKEEAEAAEKNVQVARTPLGKETIDNHPCSKNKVVVKSAKGATLLDATTWNAADMKDFPVQIAIQAKDGTTIIHFNQIQMTKPAAGQFEPPSGFVKFPNPELLMLTAAQQKQMPAAKQATPTKPAATTSKSTAGKPANASKTYAIPVQPGKPSATRK